MEPQPGRYPDNPQPISHDKDPEADEQIGAKLAALGGEIEEGTAEIVGGVGQLALGMASLFSRVFGVNPDNSQDQSEELLRSQEPPSTQDQQPTP